MSKILAPESIPCSVLLSRHLGRSAASFLQQLHYWLTKSSHIIEGAKWVFNTAEAWAEQLGLSPSTIVRVIAKLRELKLIRIERWSKHHWHQVNWFTINYPALQGLLVSIQSDCSDRPGHSEAVDEGDLSESDQETSTLDSFQTQEAQAQTSEPVDQRTAKSTLQAKPTRTAPTAGQRRSAAPEMIGVDHLSAAETANNFSASYFNWLNGDRVICHEGLEAIKRRLGLKRQP